jgi:AcrR family transcriptional regulator
MPRMGLSAEKVVAAAAELIDRDGYDALILATLADELGVRVPSLYKHIGGLDDLQQRVAHIGSTGLARAVADAAAGKRAREALVAVAAAYRRYVRTYPGRYVALTRQAPPDFGVVDQVLRRIVGDYGLADDLAVHSAVGVRSCIAGFVSADVPGDSDAAFFGVVALLDRGLASADVIPVRRPLRLPSLANRMSLVTLRP